MIFYILVPPHTHTSTTVVVQPKGHFFNSQKAKKHNVNAKNANEKMFLFVLCAQY